MYGRYVNIGEKLKGRLLYEAHRGGREKIPFDYQIGMEVIDFITKKMWSIVLIIYVAMFLETKKGFSFALANVARVDGVEEVNNDIALNQTRLLSEQL